MLFRSIEHMGISLFSTMSLKIETWTIMRSDTSFNLGLLQILQLVLLGQLGWSAGFIILAELALSNAQFIAKSILQWNFVSNILVLY